MLKSDIFPGFGLDLEHSSLLGKGLVFKASVFVVFNVDLVAPAPPIINIFVESLWFSTGW